MWFFEEEKERGRGKIFFFVSVSSLVKVNTSRWATSSTGLVSSWLVASPEERDSNSNEIRMKSK